MHPKNLFSRSICLGFIFLTFLFSPSFSRSAGLSDKIKRFIQGEADTVFSFDAETRNFVFFNAGYSLVVREKDSLKRGLNPRFTLIDFRGKVVWDTTLEWWNICRLTSDRLGSLKVVIGRYLGEGIGAETEILNSKGIRLAKVKDETSLGNSPGALYFYNFQSVLDMNRILNVYDSLGNLLWTKESNAWQAFPLSDSLLLYFALDKLLVLDAGSGGIKKDFSNEIEYSNSVFASIAASRDGQFFSLSGGSAHDTTLTSFSLETGLLWAERFEGSKERVEESSLSPDGRFLAALRIQRDMQKEWKEWEIQFRDNFARGKLIWKFQLQNEKRYEPSNLNSVSVFENLLTATIPSGYDYYYFKGIDSNTRTKCVFYDPENGSVVDSFTVSGFLTQVNSKKFGTQYFRVAYDDKSKKISVLLNKL